MKRLSFAALVLLAGCVQAAASPRKYVEEDGFYIRAYPDGSASVALGPDILDFNWSIDCRIDRMTDVRECSISSKFGGIWVGYGASDAPQTVCIMGHDFPGRRGMIRVDRNRAVRTGTDGCVSASSVLPQLVNGEDVVVRRVEWPYDYDRDEAHTLKGFRKAMEIVARIRAGTLPPTAQN
jgi:hypothetical protein